MSGRFELSDKYLRELLQRVGAPPDHSQLDRLVQLTQSSPCASFPNRLLMGMPEPEPELEVKKEQVTVEYDIWDAINRMDEIRDPVVPLDDGKCDGCGMTLELEVDVQQGSVVCSYCGVVVESQEGDIAETQNYGDDGRDGVARYGCSTDFFAPKASEGTFIAGLKHPRLEQRQRWNCTSYKGRSLEEEREKIRTVCRNNGVSEMISEDAQVIYKIISECTHKHGPNKGNYIIIRGMNRKKIVAACLYNACKYNKQPRNVREIGRYFGLAEQDVTSGLCSFDKIVTKYGCRLEMLQKYDDTDSVEDFIRRHAATLQLSPDVTMTAVQIAANASRLKIGTDHNPQSMAAGVLMVVVKYYDLDITKSDISALLDTSDVTINKIYNKLWPFIETNEALLDEEW